MNRYAIIKSGKVVNVARGPKPAGDSRLWVQSGTVKKGDLYDGSIFTTPARPPRPPKNIGWDELKRSEQVKIIDFFVTQNAITAARAAKLKG